MQSFYGRFVETATKHPNHIAVELQLAHVPGSSTSDVSVSYSYAELRRVAEHLGAWLQRQGVSAGARCAILANNGPRWVAAYLGVLAAGCVAVPLDTAFKAEQIAKLLGDSGTALLFVDARHLPLAQRALEKHPAPLVLLDTAIPV